MQQYSHFPYGKRIRFGHYGRQAGERRHGADNVAGRITVDKTASATVRSNILLQWERPEGQDYFGSAFVNAHTPMEPADLVALPDGPTARTGSGPTFARRFKPALFIGASPPARHYRFTAESWPGEGPGEKAHYAWSFGDGGTGEGPQVAHAYDREGEYPVTVRAQIKGRAWEARRTVCVPGPLLLDLPFEGTLRDGSNRGHMVIWQGPAAFTKDGRLGQAVAFDGRNHLLVRNGAPFSGLSQMRVSFAWRGEGGGRGRCRSGVAGGEFWRDAEGTQP